MPLQIAFHTGLRASEVCGLTWDSIYFENRTLTVDKILLTKILLYQNFNHLKPIVLKELLALGDTLYDLLKKNKIWQKENKLKYGEFYFNSEHDFVCLSENEEFVKTTNFRHLCQVVNKQLSIPFNFPMLRHMQHYFSLME